ncbi:GL15551 [Drosophila persimilis]|uniref:GL15551 n=1 Tax=Drosophila persimilis TaxID=7234 RepID=B4GPY1_DROPE|nr:GL15551 [Drosophila persimilis]
MPVDRLLAGSRAVTTAAAAAVAATKLINESDVGTVQTAVRRHRRGPELGLQIGIGASTLKTVALRRWDVSSFRTVEVREPQHSSEAQQPQALNPDKESKGVGLPPIIARRFNSNWDTEDA